MKETILRGIVHEEVPFSRFFLESSSHAHGANTLFLGENPLGFPETHDIENGQILTGWGCGVYAMYNVLRYYHQDVDLREVTRRARFYGASEEDGALDESIIKTLQTFGLYVQLHAFPSSFTMKRYTDKGAVVMASVIDLYYDELRDCNHRGDGHRLLVLSVDHHGSALILDSGIRSMKTGTSTFGVEVFDASAYNRCAYDFDGPTNTPETKVLAGAEWFYHEGLVVYPPTYTLQQQFYTMKKMQLLWRRLKMLCRRNRV